MKKLVPLLLLVLFPTACSRLSPPPSAENYYSWGLAHQARGDFSGAIILFTKAIELNKDFTAAYYHRGDAKQSQRDFTGAIADYNLAIQNAPSFLMAYLGRGSAKQAESDFDGALADFNKVISLSPQFGTAYICRGSLRQVRQDLRGAVEDYDKAVEYSPQFELGFIKRAGANRLLKSFSAALADYEQAVKLDETDAGGYNGRAIVKLVNANFDGAFVDLQQAIALAQTDRVRYYAHIYLWMTLAEQGRIPEAKRRLTDYLQNTQLHDPQLWMKTIAEFVLEKTDEATLLAAAKQGYSEVAVRGQTCEGWFFAGLKRRLAGDREKAADYFAKCIATNQIGYIEYLLAKAELNR